MAWKPIFFSSPPARPVISTPWRGDAPSFSRGAAALAAAAVLVAPACATRGTPGLADNGRGAEEIGAEADGSVEVRRATRTDVAETVAAARQFGLVNLAEVAPSVLIDLRYAHPDNISGLQLYPGNMPCLVHGETAAKLKRAQADLRRHGLGLRVWDAYRPPEAQTRLWRESGMTGHVANPRNGWSLHCSGSAVDVTLVDLQGFAQVLPTGFDDFSEGAAYDSAPRGSTARRNVALLQHAMSDAGFHLLEMEWWHFNDADGYGRDPVFAHQMGIELP